MLTNFFGKSNPINFFLICTGILLGYLSWVFQNQEEPFQLQNFLTKALLILLSLFLILLLDFITRKNKLTALNNYSIFIFGCLLLMIPHHILNGNIILANFFLLLAFRRIHSIQSDRNLNKKIFDSAIWIMAAFLFYYWSILFFIVLLVSIGLIRSKKNYRYFLIPIAGIITGLILVSTFYALKDQDVFWFIHLKPSFSFDINDYDTKGALFILFFVVIASLWAMIRSISKYPKLAKKHKPNQILLVLILFIGLAVSLSATNKNGIEFFFVFFPLSVLLTNAIETIKLKWLKELILWSILIAPVILFLLK